MIFVDDIWTRSPRHSAKRFGELNSNVIALSIFFLIPGLIPPTISSGKNDERKRKTLLQDVSVELNAFFVLHIIEGVSQFWTRLLFERTKQDKITQINSLPQDGK